MKLTEVERQKQRLKHIVNTIVSLRYDGKEINQRNILGKLTFENNKDEKKYKSILKEYLW